MSNCFVSVDRIIIKKTEPYFLKKLKHMILNKHRLGETHTAHIIGPAPKDNFGKAFSLR